MAKLSGDNTACILLPDDMRHLRHLRHLHHLQHLQHLYDSSHKVASAVSQKFTEIIIPYTFPCL